MDYHGRPPYNNHNLSPTLGHKNAYSVIDSYFTTHPAYQHHLPSFNTVLDHSILNELPLLPRADFQRHLYLVAFKAGRVDVYCTTTKNDLHVQVNDVVIVNVDKDKYDIGKVIRCNVPEDYVRYLKYQQHDIQENALMAGGVTVNPRDFVLCKPKQIIRFADSEDVNSISIKNEQEELASRVCRKELIRQYNSDKRGMDPTTLMDIVYCEYQFDKKKLTFYYKCSKKVSFKNLNDAMYKLYKTRIWMCILPGGLDDQFINRMQNQIQSPARQKSQQNQTQTPLLERTQQIKLHTSSWYRPQQNQLHTPLMEGSQSGVNAHNLNINNNSGSSNLFASFTDSTVHPNISNFSLNPSFTTFPPENRNKDIFNNTPNALSDRNISRSTDININTLDNTNVSYKNGNASTNVNRSPFWDNDFVWNNTNGNRPITRTNWHTNVNGSEPSWYSTYINELDGRRRQLSELQDHAQHQHKGFNNENNVAETSENPKRK